jgi:hypothetical protein
MEIDELARYSVVAATGATISEGAITLAATGAATTPAFGMTRYRDHPSHLTIDQAEPIG